MGSEMCIRDSAHLDVAGGKVDDALMVCGRVGWHGFSDVPPLALFLHKVGQRGGIGGGNVRGPTR